MCTSIYSQVRKYLDTGSFWAFAFIHHDNGFEIKQGVIKVQTFSLFKEVPQEWHLSFRIYNHFRQSTSNFSS